MECPTSGFEIRTNNVDIRELRGGGGGAVLIVVTCQF